MADGFIKVAPDSTGKELQTFENTVSGESVHAEAVVLVDQFGKPLFCYGSPGSDPIIAAAVSGSEGNVLITSNGGRLEVKVHNFSQIIIPASPGGIGKNEDDASADLDTGVACMAIRKATPSNLSDTDGDYEMLQMDGGKLWVKGDFALPAGAATEAKQDTQIATLGVTTGVAVTSDLDGTLQQYLRGLVKLIAAQLIIAVQSIDGRTGGPTDTAPATDTASAALNGRLQRLAQRLTSLIALLPASLGQKTMANSLAVTLASDQSAVPVSGSLGAKGATNVSVLRSTASTSAGTLAIARATRTGILIRNLDAAITIYVRDATVTTANGFPLLPGESAPFSWVGLIQVIAASGTPAYAAWDEYN